jgi:ABC-type antimicrobial peptide transport system permease subunit
VTRPDGLRPLWSRLRGLFARTSSDSGLTEEVRVHIRLRTALGASSASVLWLVMREVLGLLGAGLLVGIPCVLVLSQYVVSQLFGVAATDLWTASAAAAALALVAILAGWLPARRAGRIDPLVALRHE